MNPSDVKKAEMLRSSVAWVAVYFFALLAAVISLRVMVWVGTGGNGMVASVVAWISEPFVHTFNKGTGLPTFALGRGRVEVGSIVALIVYGAAGVGMWLVVSGWNEHVRRLSELWSAVTKDKVK